MPDTTLDVVTIGEALGVLTPSPGGTLRPGGLAHFGVGGAELNVAIGLSRLGHRSAWAGRVGEDAVGRAVRSVLRSEGVDDTRVVEEPGAATGIYVKEQLGLWGLQVSYHRAGSAATRMTTEDTDLDYLLSGRVLHLTGITPAISPAAEELLRDLLREAIARGIDVSFDANIRRRLLGGRDPVPLLSPFVEQADVLFLSGEECTELLDARTPEQAVERFADLRARVLIVHDASGAYAVDDSGVITVAARSLHVTDPVGAGDAFVTGYLSGHLRGWPVQDRLRLAELCAAHVVTVAGDYEGLPTEHQALAALGRLSARTER